MNKGKTYMTCNRSNIYTCVTAMDSAVESLLTSSYRALNCPLSCLGHKPNISLETDFPFTLF